MAGAKLTPMMAQYQRIRRSLPEDILLFYRLGDFYELFFEDAKEAAGILNVALTKRHEVPMCGVPHHAAQGYMSKLIVAGKRVAIAEQTSEPVPGKLVEREVRQIISAGTIDDFSLLDDKKANYLAAAYHGKGEWGLAWVDHTTGLFTLAQFASQEELQDELSRLRPSELLTPQSASETGEVPGEYSAFSSLCAVQPYDSYAFHLEEAKLLLCQHYRVQTLAGFGCENLEVALCAAGATLHYLRYQLRRDCQHLQVPSVRATADFVQIDRASQANLDLVDSKSGRAHSLLGALDATVTPMGARLLRDWIVHPLCGKRALRERQEVIALFLEQPFILAQARDSLKGVRDIERTTGRLAQGQGNARDLFSLSASLQKLPALKEDLGALQCRDLTGEEGPQLPLLTSLLTTLHDFPPLTSLLKKALAEDPPATLKEGGLIAEQYSDELDGLREMARGGKQLISDLQEKERQKTGIESLKVKFNNVFGYFIEVTKSHLSKVPDSYLRKQTTANAERYITPELKEMENQVLGADERSRQLEFELFCALRGEVREFLVPLQQTAATLAQLDVLLGLAECAQQHNYVRPELVEEKVLEIKGGRHPVLEQIMEGDPFIPNDALLGHDCNRLIILTGPNMAGKSTYIRQVALLTLMAQIGSFVPAEEATIGLVDRIFCRVGASDDLTKGHSTFMVEMTETALIVNNATDRSLVILDEIGRGTATYDGLSIAWSVAEHLHDTIACRTLFATHYHELTDLASSAGYGGVANYHVAVREWNEEIVFLRQILAGPADQSYGIAVAKLAGLPREILARAKELLEELEGLSARSVPAVETGVHEEDPQKKEKKREEKAKSEVKKAGPARGILRPKELKSPGSQLDLFP